MLYLGASFAARCWVRHSLSLGAIAALRRTAASTDGPFQALPVEDLDMAARIMDQSVKGEAPGNSGVFFHARRHKACPYLECHMSGTEFSFRPAVSKNVFKLTSIEGGHICSHSTLTASLTSTRLRIRR